MTITIISTIIFFTMNLLLCMLASLYTPLGAERRNSSMQAAAAAEDVTLVEREQGQTAALSTRHSLKVALPEPQTNPTPDEPTPLSSLGGGLSHARTPLSNPGAKENTALFYNGLFRASLNRHEVQGMLNI